MCLPVFHRLTGKVFPAPSSGCSVSLSSGARSSQQPSALTAPPHYQSISPQGCRRVLGRLLNNSELIFFFVVFCFRSTRCEHPARLIREREAGRLWSQQTYPDHLHVWYWNQVRHWHPLLDEPGGHQRGGIRPQS